MQTTQGVAEETGNLVLKIKKKAQCYIISSTMQMPVAYGLAGSSRAFSPPPLGGHRASRPARDCQSILFFGR